MFCFLRSAGVLKSKKKISTVHGLSIFNPMKISIIMYVSISIGI